MAPNLEVKEVVVGDGERRRRYVVCFNAEEAKRQQAHRAQILAELEAVLPNLQARSEGAHSKRACILRASARYGQYLTQDRHGRLALDPAKVRQAERLDGKFVVHSNDDTLTPDDLALGYKQSPRWNGPGICSRAGCRFGRSSIGRHTASVRTSP